MRSILRPRRRKGAKCAEPSYCASAGDGKGGCSRSASPARNKGGCSRTGSPVRSVTTSCSLRSTSPDPCQKYVAMRNSSPTRSPPRCRKAANQCSHSPPPRGATPVDSTCRISPETDQHVGVLLLNPAMFFPNMGANPTMFPAPAMFPAAVSPSPPMISPPPQDHHEEEAMQCRHSPQAEVGRRGGDARKGRVASPARKNFDATFSQSTVSPEVKGKSELVVCFGELLIDFVPTVGGLSLADAPAFKKAPGGAPANVAVGIAKLGGNSAFVGKVGDDEFGYMLVEVLKENRVETKGCRFDPKARTALAFVTLRADGEREFMFYRNPSADMLFETKELDTDILKAASIMHYGSISLITEPSRSTHIEALRVAREGGCLLSYDPNLRLPLWPSPQAAKDGIKSIWDQADIIKVSDEEVVFLTGGDPKSDDNNMRMFHPRCKLMLVTEGGEGCRYYTQRFRGKVGGIKVQVVDTTGAGDAFCAGLLSQLAKDFGIIDDETRLREALKFANACGAITTTERGAIPSMPDKDMVLRMLRRPSAVAQSSTQDSSWQGYHKWRVRHSSIME